MTPVIIVSDDPLVVNTTKIILQNETLITHLTRSEIETRCDVLLKSEIILSDIGDSLPVGLDDIARIRRSHAKALVLLARDLTRDERLQAIAAGADQILSNPPDREELVLVLRNLARLKSLQWEGSPKGEDPEEGWILDETHWCLRTPSGHEVQLQRAEAAILAKLFSSPGTSQSRQDLAASFKSDREDKNRSLDVAISKIRRKVRDASNLTLPLRSIRGIGYVFTASASFARESAFKARDSGNSPEDRVREAF